MYSWLGARDPAACVLAIVMASAPRSKWPPRNPSNPCRTLTPSPGSVHAATAGHRSMQGLDNKTPQFVYNNPGLGHLVAMVVAPNLAAARASAKRLARPSLREIRTQCS